MVRATTTDAAITDQTQLLNARGDNRIILAAEDECPALKECCPWLPWMVVEGEESLPYHEWMALLMIRKPNVDPGIVIEAQHFSLEATDRVWGAIRAAGFFKVLGTGPADRQRVKHELLKIGESEGDKVRFTQEDLIASVPTAPPPVSGGGGNGAPAGRGRGRGRQAAVPIGQPVIPAVAILTPRDVGAELTFGLLCPEGDERGAVLSDFFYFTGTCITAAQRAEGTQYSKALAKLIAASGMEGALANSADEAAVIITGLLADMQVPTMFCISTQPGPARTVELALLTRSRGVLDHASIKGRLAQAVRGGELPLLANMLSGVVAGPEMSTLINEVGSLLNVQQGGLLSDALLYRIERELSATGCTAAGSDAMSRVAALTAYLRSRASAIETAPRNEAVTQDGKAESVTSHSKAHVVALYRLYQTPNFQQQEQALMRLADAKAVLFLALTGRFLSERIGNACGPADAAELEQSTGKDAEGNTTGPGWAPIPIFHQVVWGQVEALQGKIELNKLAAMRPQPKLLGCLAARGLRGADDAGLIRLQTLELPQLYEQLKGRSWLTSLDIVNDLWLRLLAHYHDEDGSKQKRLQAHDSCGDWSVFQGVLEPLSHVMQVVGIPLTGPCSLARCMTPIQTFWMLHGPAAGPTQRATIEAACATYFRSALEDYVTSYNLVRNRADATVTFACMDRLGYGNPSMTITQQMAGFNASISRKRAGGGGGAGEAGTMGTPLKFPRTAWGVAQGTDPTAAPTKLPPATQGGAAGKSKGLPPPGDYFTDKGSGVWEAPNGWAFNAAGAQAWLQSHGHGDKCLHAMLLSGAPTQAFKVQVAKACKRVGKPHQEGGAAHKPPADWKPADFVTRRGGKAGH